MLIKIYQYIIKAGHSEKIKYAQLVPAAITAAKTPETGIKVINPIAKNVIQDLAIVSKKYLPLEIYDQLGDKALSKIKKLNPTADDLQEFALLIEDKDIVATSLYRTMASHAGIDLDESEDFEFDYEIDPSNVYGNYSAAATEISTAKSTSTNDVQQILERIFL
jgi:hypothetical protein